MVVEHRAHLAPAATRDDRLADAQRAALDQRGDDGTPARVEVRLEHERARRRLRVGHELLDVGHEQDRVEQLVDAEPFRRGHLVDDRVAAPLLGDEPVLDELLAHAVGVGVLAVDLGDRDDDRHLGRAGVADRLDRLRHHAVVGGDDEDRDVGRLRAAGSHRGEGLVTRCVDEGDDPAVLLDLVRTDVLGDPAGLARDDVGLADAVEERRLAVVDVTHHGDDRRRGSRSAVVVVVLAEHRLQLELGLLAGLDEQDLGAERLADELDHLVGQRLRAGDHLARVEEQPHEVGGVAVQPGRELLDRDAARHDDLALGDRRVERRERGRRRRTEVLEVATTPLLATRALTGRDRPDGRVRRRDHRVRAHHRRRDHRHRRPDRHPGHCAGADHRRCADGR